MTDPSSSSCEDEKTSQDPRLRDSQTTKMERKTHERLIPSIIELELEISTFGTLRQHERLKILLRDDMTA